MSTQTLMNALIGLSAPECFSVAEDIDFAPGMEDSGAEISHDYYVNARDGELTLEFSEPAAVAHKPAISPVDIAGTARSSGQVDPYVTLLSAEAAVRGLVADLRHSAERFVDAFRPQLFAPAFAGPQLSLPYVAMAGVDGAGGAANSSAGATDEEIGRAIKGAIEGHAARIDTRLWPEFLERDMPAFIAEVRKKIEMIERAGQKTTIGVIAGSVARAWLARTTGPDAAYDRYVEAVRSGRMGYPGCQAMPKQDFLKLEDIDRSGIGSSTTRQRFTAIEEKKLAAGVKIRCFVDGCIENHIIRTISVDGYLDIKEVGALSPVSVDRAEVRLEREEVQIRIYLDDFIKDERVVPASFRAEMEDEWLDQLTREIVASLGDVKQSSRDWIGDGRQRFTMAFLRRRMYSRFSAEVDAAYARYLKHIASGRFGREATPLSRRNFASSLAPSTNAFDNLREIEARGLWIDEHVRRKGYKKAETILFITEEGKLIFSRGRGRAKKVTSDPNGVSPYDVENVRMSGMRVFCGDNKPRRGR